MAFTSLGIVFPGQGSQYVGMLQDIASNFSDVQEVFHEASEVLGYDLWQLIQRGPAEELDKTIHTQPALLAASYAIWRILMNQKKLKPTMLAGHSLGEYTALVCSGSIPFVDAIRLVAKRGQYMQEASPIGGGALAAIVGLDDAIVQSICEKARLADEVLSPANFNSKGHIVIAGHVAAVLRAIILAKEQGAKLAKQLSVSVPSHCILMKPAADKLEDFLKTVPISSPAIPVLNNVDVTVYTTPASIRDGLKRQLFMPVRWVEIIQTMTRAGISHIMECGPGKVLSGLNKRIASDLQLINTVDLANLQQCLQITF